MKMDANENQQPPADPATETVLKLCGTAWTMLADFSHEVALQILTSLVANQIAARADSLPAAMAICANVNGSTVTKVIFTLATQAVKAEQEAADAQAEQGPPPGVTVN